MSPTLPRSSRVLKILPPLGFYFILVAVQVLAVFVINSRSMENDVFLGNLFIGPVFAIIGIALFATGLATARYAARFWELALLLAIGGAALFGLYYWLFGNRYLAFHETVSSLPPYLGNQGILISSVLGLAVGILSWFLPDR